MAPREFRHAIEDMRAAILGIQKASAGKTLSDYAADWLLKHGIQRGIEIISEASRALPEEVEALHPTIPWRNIRGIGNVLRHDYFGLSDDIIWRVVQDELPRLIAALDALLNRFSLENDSTTMPVEGRTVE